MKYVAIFLLKVYKATFSRLKGRHTCIFTPSCSVYAMEAYREYGFVKGSWLTAKRLLRCRPNGKAGFDPLALNVKGNVKKFV